MSIVEWAAARGWPAEPWFDSNGYSPIYLWHREPRARGHWPTAVYNGEPLVRFTALTFPA